MSEHRNNTSRRKQNLETLFAMIWVDSLTPDEKKRYSSEIEEVTKYDKYIPKVQRLYDYYMLYKWPIANEKLQKLIKKYKGR